MRLLISAFLSVFAAQDNEQNCGDLEVLANFCTTINGTISKRWVQSVLLFPARSWLALSGIDKSWLTVVGPGSSLSVKSENAIQ